MAAPVRLFYAAASPFARKCRVVIRERGITGVEEIKADPLASPEALVRANPLSQIPTLVLDDGSGLFDSPVICAFLDTMGPDPALSPAADFDVQRRQALGDGIAELALKLRYEQVRAENERSPGALARWRAGVNRGLDAAEAEYRPEDRFDIGEIALYCALSYLDLRHDDMAWRDGRPKLNAFAARLEQRPSFVATKA
jgi:glutathione S-transferase